MLAPPTPWDNTNLADYLSGLKRATYETSDSSSNKHHHNIAHGCYLHNGTNTKNDTGDDQGDLPAKFVSKRCCRKGSEEAPCLKQ